MTDGRRGNWPPIGQVAAALNARIGSLAPELLSAGKRKGNYWVCGSVYNDPGQSLSVHLTGAKQGVWADHGTGGDALDLLAAARYGGDRGAAYKDGLTRLGFDINAPAPEWKPPPPPAPASDRPARRNHLEATALFLEAKPGFETPADFYLRGRRIDLRELGHWPGCLRFHPSVWQSEVRMRLPAMLAAINDEHGNHVATHRTWLEYAGGGWIKARVPTAKMSLGLFAGGSIHLWKGWSGRKLKDMPPGDDVFIGEGIETCLSVVLEVPELRVLSGISQGNMGGVWVPDHAGQIILALDNDTNPDAIAGGHHLKSRWLQRGFKARVARSPFGKDFNDALIGEAVT